MDGKLYKSLLTNPSGWWFTSSELYELSRYLYGIWKEEFDIETADGAAPNDYSPVQIRTKWTKLHLLPISFMLMGYAIENLVKGLKVVLEIKTDSSKGETVTFESMGLKGHDIIEQYNRLRKKASSIDLDLIKDPSVDGEGLKGLRRPLTTEEKKALRVAEDYVTWRSKYPFPITANSTKIPWGRKSLWGEEFVSDMGVLDTLYHRLDQAYEETRIGVVHIGLPDPKNE